MIKIYTDGSCLGNPGKGGWAAIIFIDGKKIKIKGGKKNTTNNKMELLAPIQALKKISVGKKIEIYTDSKYLKLGKGKICAQVGHGVHKAVEYMILKNPKLYKSYINQFIKIGFLEPGLVEKHYLTDKFLRK